MSRSLNHVRYKHWNIKRPRVATVYRYGIGAGLFYEEETMGAELYDLRFYAGCKRVPQTVHRVRYDYSYTRTWGHANGVARSYAKEQAGMHRAAVRAYGRDIVKAYRSGGDLDEYTEPEGRTRHRALWEAF